MGSGGVDGELPRRTEQAPGVTGHYSIFGRTAKTGHPLWYLEGRGQVAIAHNLIPPDPEPHAGSFCHMHTTAI
jgi:hypothetical protein